MGNKRALSAGETANFHLGCFTFSEGGAVHRGRGRSSEQDQRGESPFRGGPYLLLFSGGLDMLGGEEVRNKEEEETLGGGGGGRIGLGLL